MIKTNRFVQVYHVVLTSAERAEHLPLDTKEVPFEIRMKGILQEDANIGDYCMIKTATNRIEKGILIKENPFYDHSFGHHVSILKDIRTIILKETENLK